MRDPRLIAYAKQMRREPTEAEKRMWLALRANRFFDIKFRKQKVIGPYIVDFSSREPMIVVEIDGDTHAETANYDAVRTAILEQQGYRVVRFSNSDVMRNFDGVLAVLSDVVMRPPLPSGADAPPSLSPQGERDL